MSRATQGVLILIGGMFAIGVLSNVLRPTPPPAPPKTAEETAKLEVEKKVTEERAKKDEAIFLKTPGGKLWQRHKDWDRDACETIAKRQIHVGMTADQVRAAWGKPEHNNTSTYSTGTHEQWVYSSGSYDYFENGVMTAVQQTK